MDSPPPNYRCQFWKSPHHVWLALLALGGGFVSAQPLFLLAGATAYVLGLIYLPDMGIYRRWVDRRRQAALAADQQAQLDEFVRRRESTLRQLSTPRRERYLALAAVCRDIESVSREPALGAPDPAVDPRLRKLDELMWTYLRLLALEESLDHFLETEVRESLPERAQEAERDVAQLALEIEQLDPQKDAASRETKQRLRDSRLELLEVLRKRLRRLQQARDNLAFVRSEQERLDQQIKLIRADSVALKGADALSSRIDATVQHLEETNRWIGEIDQFRDLVGDLPPADIRVGYGSAASAPPVAVPPVIPTIQRPSSSRTASRR